MERTAVSTVATSVLRILSTPEISNPASSFALSFMDIFGPEPFSVPVIATSGTKSKFGFVFKLSDVRAISVKIDTMSRSVSWPILSSPSLISRLSSCGIGSPAVAAATCAAAVRSNCFPPIEVLPLDSMESTPLASAETSIE